MHSKDDGEAQVFKRHFHVEDRKPAVLAVCFSLLFLPQCFCAQGFASRDNTFLLAFLGSELGSDCWWASEHPNFCLRAEVVVRETVRRLSTLRANTFKLLRCQTQVGRHQLRGDASTTSRRSRVSGHCITLTSNLR